MDNKIKEPVISLTNKLKYRLGYFQGKSKVVTTVIGVTMMAGISMFVAYASLNRRSITNDNIGAANPSCYLSLTLNKPSPTPVSTPNCQICNYQVDAFFGPVIDNFAGGLRYQSPTYRLINSFDDKTRKHVACPLATITTPQTNLSVPTFTTDCDRPIYNKYLIADFSNWNPSVPPGYTIAKITNTTSSCTYTVGAASYKVAWQTTTQPNTPAEYASQNLFDSKITTLGPKASVELLVKIPTVNPDASCYPNLTP